MVNDRKITITAGASRKSVNWQPQTLMLSEFYEKLRIPARSTETMQEYLKLGKPEQDDRKDIGGFVAGSLRGSRRKAGAVTGRDVITLDFDNIPPGGTEEIVKRVEALGCGYCVYSTRKHSPATPRLRILLPYDRTATADEYEPTSRYLALCIGIEFADPTTFEASRLMYWPSCCSDAEYVFYAADKPMLSVDGLLKVIDEKFGDWRDVTKWPQVPGAENNFKKLALRQSDPLSKDNIIGAFCRTYDIYGAIDTFLSSVYEPVAGTSGRFTYLGGSTTGGAVVYDNGLFLYSHHSTDPCSGRLVNAFDMVRLHKFGDLDDEADAKMPPNRLPSYLAMCELAVADEKVSDTLAQERASSVIEDFKDAVNETNLIELGHCAKQMLSIEIVRLALKTFGIEVRQNLITGKIIITGMPEKYSREESVNTLPIFLMDILRKVGVKGVTKTAITDYLANIADESRFNPVVDMLHSATWDGKDRFPELLRIMGVSSDSLHAVLIKKWLIQSVALAHNTAGETAVAADGVLTLQGAQGIGKTLLIRRLAISEEWLAEGISLDVKDKDSKLQATGAWIAELGELDSTLKREQTALKAFITNQSDRIRAPYAREFTDRPRRTSFAATVNPAQFLRDDTGDRRFWVVPVSNIDLQTLTSLTKEWFMQLWAEVYLWWKINPGGFRLTSAERAALDKANQAYREMLAGEEEILLAFQRELPTEQWGKFTPSEIKHLLFSGEKISVQQVGRVLAKLEREENGRVTVVGQDSHSKVKTYRLPIRKIPVVQI